MLISAGVKASYHGASHTAVVRQWNSLSGNEHAAEELYGFLKARTLSRPCPNPYWMVSVTGVE
jgi:hypothetical protein